MPGMMVSDELSSALWFSPPLPLLRHVHDRTSVMFVLLLLFVSTTPAIVEATGASFSIHPATETTRRSLVRNINGPVTTATAAPRSILQQQPQSRNISVKSVEPLVGCQLPTVSTPSPVECLDKRKGNVGDRKKQPTAVVKPSRIKGLKSRKQDSGDDRSKLPRRLKADKGQDDDQTQPSMTPAPVATDDNQNNGNGDDRTKQWIAVGVAVVGALLLLCGVMMLVCCCRRRSNNNDNDDDRKHQGPGKHVSAPSPTSLAPGGGGATTTASGSSRLNLQPSHYGSESAGHNNWTFSEIDMDRQDEISTLGDPIYGNNNTQLGHHNNSGMILGADDHGHKRPESTHARYDDFAQGTVPTHKEEEESESVFRKSPAVSRPSKALDGDGHTGHDVFSEDSFFGIEEQAAFNTERNSGAMQRFAVEVPAGKLGMVIDTPNGGGPPMVHTIKSESVLIDRVRAGDQLAAVDHEDVTRMTAVEVSKLINVKSDQQRLLAFVRTRADSFDSADLALKQGAF